MANKRVPLKPTTTPFELLLSLATPEMLSEAIEMAGLDKKEVITILLARHLNPLMVLEEQQEWKVRGLHKDTLREWKQDGLLPRKA
jgi:hypothetical protein